MEKTSNPAKGPAVRHLSLLVIFLATVVGFFTLRDYLTFETLRQNREALLAFRDANYIVMVLVFTAIYIVIVAFSLPGAAVASVTGGFLFGLFFWNYVQRFSGHIRRLRYLFSRPLGTWAHVGGEDGNL